MLAGWLAARAAHLFGRDTRHRTLRRNILEHHGPRRDFGFITNRGCYRALLRPPISSTPFPIFGMAIADSPCRYRLSVTPCRSEQSSPTTAVSPIVMSVAWSSITPLPIVAAGMDVDGEQFAGARLEMEGQCLAALLPKMIGDAVGLQCQEALKEQEGLQHASGRRGRDRVWLAYPLLRLRPRA